MLAIAYFSYGFKNINSTTGDYMLYVVKSTIMLQSPYEPGQGTISKRRRIKMKPFN